MRGQARQRITALEHTFQRRGVLARALGADLRQHTPADFFVVGGDLKLRFERGDGAGLECARDVLGLRFVAGEQSIIDLVGKNLGVVGQQVAADPGP